MPGMCVQTMNVFEHEGCIEEERDERKKREKETAATKEVKIKLARKESHKTDRKHKRQMQGVNRSKTQIETGHQNVLSTQPLISAMARDTLNMLWEMTIPRADKGVITLLL